MAKKNKTPKVVRLSEMPEPAPRHRPTGDAFILDPNARYSQYSQMAKPKTSGPEDAPVNGKPARLVNPATNLPYAGKETKTKTSNLGDVINTEQSGRHKKPLGDREEFDPGSPIHPSNNPAFGNFSTRENGNFKARTIDWDKVPMGGGNATVNGKTLTVGEAMRSGMVQDPRWYFSGHPQSNDLMMGATIDGLTPPEFIEPTDIPDEWFKPNANTYSDTGSTTIPNRPPPEYGFDFFGPIPEFSDVANTIPLTDDEKWSAYEYNKEMRRIEGVNFGKEENRRKREVDKIKALIKEKFGPDAFAKLDPNRINIVEDAKTRSGLEESNMAQQEPARQDSALRQDERDLAEDEARTQRAELAVDFEREMNPNQGQEDLDDLGRTVRDERRSEIFEPSNLTAAGRSEFDAAARGEIPGYAIKDPGARAAFSKAREYDIGFGSKERQRSDAIHSPYGPDHPWDQGMMDDLQSEGDRQTEEADQRGVNKRDNARIQTYEEAKKNGRLGLYNAKDIKAFEEALEKRDLGESFYNDPLTEREGFTGDSPDFDYEAMGERAQKGQQPRSAGGIGEGPLKGGMDPKSRDVLGKRLADAEERIKNAKFPKWKDLELRDNLNRVLGDGKSNLRGNVVSDPASGSGKPTRPRRQNEPRRGRGGGGGGGRGVAYPEQPLPASQRDPNSSEGGAYTLPDGGMIPNPDGMSESDFNDAVFNNPVPMEEAFQYAMENGQMTKAEQEELQQLQTQGYPASVSPHQREAYDANRKATLGKLASNVFRKNIRHAEVQRSKDARDRTAEANSERVERDRLARIYRQKINPKTKNKMGEFGFLMPEFMGDTDLVEEATRALTDKEFLAAKAWDAKETAAYRASQGKVAGEVKAAEAGQAPPSSEPHWTFAKSDQDKIYGGLSNTSGTEYGIWSQDDKLYLRMTVKEWDDVAPEDRSNVAGIILPPQGANPTQWSNPGMQVMSLPRGAEFVTAGPDGALQVKDYNSDAARPEAAPPEAAKSAPLPGVTFSS